MMYVAVLAGFALFFLTMAVGVLMGRKPIAGSCGGLAQVGLNGECKVCGKTPGSCDTDDFDGSKGKTAQSSDVAVKSINAVDAMAGTAKQQPQGIRAQLQRKPGQAPDPLDF